MGDSPGDNGRRRSGLSCPRVLGSRRACRVSSACPAGPSLLVHTDGLFWFRCVKHRGQGPSQTLSSPAIRHRIVAIVARPLRLLPPGFYLKRRRQADPRVRDARFGGAVCEIRRGHPSDPQSKCQSCREGDGCFPKFPLGPKSGDGPHVRRLWRCWPCGHGGDGASAPRFPAEAARGRGPFSLHHAAPRAAPGPPWALACGWASGVRAALRRGGRADTSPFIVRCVGATWVGRATGSGRVCQAPSACRLVRSPPSARS